MPLDALFISVTRIRTYDDPEKDPIANKVMKTGTGFFYENKKREYFLVTNRHLVRDEANGYFPNLLRITLHTNLSDTSQSADFDIRLYGTGAKKLWREPTGTEDLVAIPLDTEEILGKRHMTFYAFNKSHLFPDDYVPAFAEEVLVIGYPLGLFFDDRNNLPIIRSGIISNAYPLTSNVQPYFLIDSRLHEGTSGSPVITKSKDNWRRKDGSIARNGFQFFLLGVNAATFPIPKEPDPNDGVRSGLNAVIFAEYVDEIVNRDQDYSVPSMQLLPW